MRSPSDGALVIQTDRTAAQRRAALVLLVAGIILWIPLVHRLLGRDNGFVGRLGFVHGSPGPWLAWLLAAVFAVTAGMFTLRRVPGVAAYALAMSWLKGLALFAAVGAAVVEEALFRRVVMDGLQGAGYGVLVQVVVSSVLFGAAHGAWAVFTRAPLVGAKATLATAVLGVGFGVIYIVGERSLAPVITAHFFIDALIQPGILVSAFQGQWTRSTSNGSAFM